MIRTQSLGEGVFTARRAWRSPSHKMASNLPIENQQPPSQYHRHTPKSQKFRRLTPTIERCTTPKLTCPLVNDFGTVIVKFWCGGFAGSELSYCGSKGPLYMRSPRISVTLISAHGELPHGKSPIASPTSVDPVSEFYEQICRVVMA